MKVCIFIETGASEARKSAGRFTNEHCFVDQYVRHLFPGIADDCFEIVDVGGKDKLDFFDNKMRENTMRGDRNVVIFDCDDEAGGGGLARRREGLESLKEALGVKFDHFLFPNDRDDGAFEDMLLNIINPEHKGVVECFSRYEACVRSRDAAKGGGVYETPNIKAKVYTYITSFKRSRSAAEKVKHGDWDFSNKEYWDLDSEYLAPLKSFLLSAFKEVVNSFQIL